LANLAQANAMRLLVGHCLRFHITRLFGESNHAVLTQVVGCVQLFVGSNQNLQSRI
jgi:hypothetical protein